MKTKSRSSKNNSGFKMPPSVIRNMVILNQIRVPEGMAAPVKGGDSLEERGETARISMAQLKVSGMSSSDLSLIPKSTRTNYFNKEGFPRLSSLHSILSDSIIHNQLQSETDRTMQAQNTTIQDHFSLKKTYKLYAQRRNTDEVLETARDSRRDSNREIKREKYIKKKPKSNEVGGLVFNDTVFPVKRHFSTHRMIESDSSESQLQEISSGRITGYGTNYGTFAKIGQDYERLAQKYRLNPVNLQNTEVTQENFTTNRFKKDLRSTAERFSEESFIKKLGIKKATARLDPPNKSLRELKAEFSWYLHEIDSRPSLRVMPSDRKDFKKFVEQGELNTLIERSKGILEKEKEDRRIINKLEALNEEMKKSKNRPYNKFLEIPYDVTLRNLERIKRRELNKYIVEYYKTKGNKANEFTIGLDDRKEGDEVFEEDKILSSIHRGKKFSSNEFETLMLKQLVEEDEKQKKRGSFIQFDDPTTVPQRIFTKRGSFLLRDRSKLKSTNPVKVLSEKEKKKLRIKEKLFAFVKQLNRLGLSLQQFMISSPLSKAPFTHLKSKEFISAVKAGDDQAVCLLLQENQYLVQDYDYTHQTPLHWAAKRGFYEIAKILLRKGADPNALDLTLRTPLYYACRGNQVETVKLLLLNKAKPWSTRNCDYNDPHISDKVVSYLKKARHIHIGLSLSRKDRKKMIWVEESKIFERELNSDKEETESPENQS